MCRWLITYSCFENAYIWGFWPSRQLMTKRGSQTYLQYNTYPSTSWAAQCCMEIFYCSTTPINWRWLQIYCCIDFPGPHLNIGLPPRRAGWLLFEFKSICIFLSSFRNELFLVLCAVRKQQQLLYINERGEFKLFRWCAVASERSILRCTTLKSFSVAATALICRQKANHYPNDLKLTRKRASSAAAQKENLEITA